MLVTHSKLFLDSIQGDSLSSSWSKVSHCSCH